MRDIDLAAELAERAAAEVTDPIASPAIAEAVAASFGALLADRDVAEIGSLEGGSVDVLRRGRRQRLDVILEGPLFALLREAGALTAVLTMRLPHGPRANVLGFRTGLLGYITDAKSVPALGKTALGFRATGQCTMYMSR